MSIDDMVLSFSLALDAVTFLLVVSMFYYWKVKYMEKDRKIHKLTDLSQMVLLRMDMVEEDIDRMCRGDKCTTRRHLLVGGERK